MRADLNIDPLIGRWKDALDRGQTPTAAELCRECPQYEGVLGLEMAIREWDRPRTSKTEINPARSESTGLDHRTGSLREFRLVNRIGKGGAGEVWKAISPDGRSVAIKWTGVANEVETLAEGVREGCDHSRLLDLTHRVRHPNVLDVHDDWRYAGGRIIVMELADGTLMDRLDEALRGGSPGIPGPDLLEPMRQAARGIDHLNQPRQSSSGAMIGAGIVHRDIKPRNLLVVGGCVKVGDLEQAALFEDAVHDTGCLTTGYASPELLQGQMSLQSDQYALAVTYCQLRGGRLPFVGSPYHVMMGHFQGTPDLRMIPARERPAVARALSKRPSNRWPDCQAFVAALAEAGLGEIDIREPISPAVVRRGPEGRRASRRLVRGIGVIAVVLLATLAAVVSREAVARRMTTVRNTGKMLDRSVHDRPVSYSETAPGANP